MINQLLVIGHVGSGKMKKRQKLGKNIQNLKNSSVVKIGTFANKTKAGIQTNFWRSKGYNTKTRKTKKGIIAFRSKKKV